MRQVEDNALDAATRDAGTAGIESGSRRAGEPRATPAGGRGFSTWERCR